MTLEGTARAGGLSNRIDVEYDTRHFGPIRAFGIGVEKPQIGDEVLLVVPRQRSGCRGSVSNFWSQ